ncbi:MAG: asparagine synthase (glutamine-hydrolyzing) [Chloroflexi bacterium]|nr:asparagine synthase (glutamine-hydrolyzing) [Chloroflexota bacterium]
MCGICGILHLDSTRTAEHNVVERMADVIRHRGPDDEGYYVDGPVGLAHKRLSIIDLSEAGHQPMTNEDGRYWIIFNGEIYNYQELRQQVIQRGHKMRSNSDTEVILHLYEDEGAKCLAKLNGMFSFVIWDTKEQTLFAARDRFGVKPFYYSLYDNTFLFGSEIKALLAYGEFPVAIHYDALADYLALQFTLGKKTLFDGVQKLLPGYCLTIKPGQSVQLQKYWGLDFHIDTDHTENYFEHQLLRLLEDSVRIQLRADVPVGAHLSGGLDSSTVAALASSLLDSPIHTFSGGFKDDARYDETHHARLVADLHHTLHHEVYPTDRDFVDILPRLIYHMDEPAAGPGLFPQYYVSKLASENVKVVLGGQGGDEIFGGYTRYLVAYLEECIRGGIQGNQEDDKYVVTFESILPNLPQLQGYQPMLQNFWADGVFDTPDQRYLRLIHRGNEMHNYVDISLTAGKTGYKPEEAFSDLFNEGQIGSYINKMTRFDMLTLLPALLHVEDRTSMAVSLESRVPLLDHRIAELVASMPPKIKYKGGRSKHIFRKIVQNIVPTQIYDRKDKMGFPVPLNEWYQKEPVRGFVMDTISSLKARRNGFLQDVSVDNLVTSERAFGRNIWGLLSLELWMENFLDGNYRSFASR